MCSQQNALFTYDLPHRSLIAKHPISNNRTKQNVVEQKNSRKIVDGMVMDEVDMETDFNLNTDKNKDLILPGSNVKEHNNLNGKLQSLELKGTGLMQISSDNRFLVVLSNEGVGLFQIGDANNQIKGGRLDLDQIQIDQQYLSSKFTFNITVRPS